MASVTGIPDQNSNTLLGHGEEEPLLGRPGDASQQDGKALYHNLWIGTGVVAQAGIWILVGIVWAAIFSHDLILFSAHPLLNSAGLLLVTQAILILQPTHTATQKRHGTYTHFGLNGLGLSALIAGLVIIELNKFGHNGTHFESPHAILGLITYIFFLLQSLVGFTQYFIPQLYGSVDSAKKMYKYHRVSGYVILTLGLVTIAAATQTDYNKDVLGIKLWAVIVAAVLVLAGVLPRIKKVKLGL
ncbi:cytochrome b561 [Lepidopterella palustris CBS 459.81]|uniref:Cytochrome b561 n=1 Tax=Lepidopterella palustris CBS 459.81 TaxID=1314670 RepID=A0A8E2E6L8_9PEZI|nr:cytochrome b561 [Lepidopterella palustris CBS 459.81]